jgi:hypothetical protein
MFSCLADVLVLNVAGKMAGSNSFKSCHKQIGKSGWLTGIEPTQ